MYFKDETVKEIVITWQNKPKKFELLFFYGGYWKSLGVKEATTDKYTVEIGVKMISGLKIILNGA
jgi:hypothetical protein